MKKAYLVGAVLIVAFGALGFAQLKNTMTTYVGFAEARAAESSVQVKGKIDKSSVHYDKATKDLVFDITDDKGDVMTVVYGRSAPGNFNQASHVVAVGQYVDGKFIASDLLIKCPSKYQGQSYPGGK